MRRMKLFDVRIVCVVLVYVCVAGNTFADSRYYTDYVLLKVEVEGESELVVLEKTGAVILNCIPGVGEMRVVAGPKQLDEINTAGLKYTVLHDDVQQLIDKERDRPFRSNPYEEFFLDYHQYDNGVGSILWYMNQLVLRYPALVTMVEVGITVEGRTIWGLRITGDTAVNKPAVLIVGCQHAREWITSTTGAYFATHLLQNYGVDSLVTELVDNVEFYIIPVVNIDGFEYSWLDSSTRLWRKNRRDNSDGSWGVDLNRNWGVGWGGTGSGSSPWSELYHGSGPFSEPETASLRDFILEHSNIRSFWDIHSFSQLILWPYGYTAELPLDADYYLQVGLSMQAAIYGVHGRSYGAGPTYTAIYPTAGGSLDWVYDYQDALAFGLEMRPQQFDPGNVGFELPAEEIIEANQEIVPAILLAADTDWVRLPIRFVFPDSLPRLIEPGEETIVEAEIRDQFEVFAAGTASLNYRYRQEDSFVELTMIETTGDKVYAVLPPADCQDAPEFYLTATSEEGAVVFSPPNAPDDTYKVVISNAEEVFYQENMDENPGWDTEGSWAWGVPQGKGSHNRDPVAGYTGEYVYGFALDRQHVLNPLPGSFVPIPVSHTGLTEVHVTTFFNDWATGDYRSDQPALYLTTPEIDCSGRYDVNLRFRRWLGVESSSPNFDDATIEVSANGIHWHVVWRASDTGNNVSDDSWQLQRVSLSGYADNCPSVRIRWGMGPTDSYVTYPGWNIDDVELTSAVCEMK